MKDSYGMFFSYNPYTQKLRDTGVKGTVTLPVCFYEKSALYRCERDIRSLIQNEENLTTEGVRNDKSFLDGAYI